MTELTKAVLCEAVRETLAPFFASAQGPAQLKETIADTPTLQVYPEEWNTDDKSGTDRTTFRAGVRQSKTTIYADAYVRQRATLGEDMAKLVTVTDLMDAELDQQRDVLFGNTSIKSYHWSARRVEFKYNDVLYVGARYTLDIWIY